MGLAFLSAGVAPCLAADAFMGTWKLNEAKSKFNPRGGKNTTVVYERVGDKVKVTIDGTNSQGAPAHSEWIGKFDGKDYAVTGNPGEDTRAVKKIDEHTVAFTVRKDGKVTATGRIAISPDGKTRILTEQGTGSNGAMWSQMLVYDKQP